MSTNLSFSMYYNTVICGLPGSTIFFLRYLTNGTIFGEKIAHKIYYVLIFSTTFV